MLLYLLAGYEVNKMLHYLPPITKKFVNAPERQLTVLLNYQVIKYQCFEPVKC